MFVALCSLCFLLHELSLYLICRSWFCITVISVNMQRPPMKSVAQLRKNRSCVLWEFFLVLVLLQSFKFGSLLMS